MRTKYILITIMIAFANICFAQDDLFSKYANRDDVTIVNISSKMFNMFKPYKSKAKTSMSESSSNSKNNMMNLDIDKLKNKLTGLQILSTENKTIAKEMKIDFSSLGKHGYEELMNIKDDDSKVLFYVKEEGDIVKDLIMLVSETNEYTVIRLKGNFSLSDIQEITNP